MLTPDQQTQQVRQRAALTVMLILLATLAINLLSAYIRHVESGLGCDAWPSCYGQIASFVTLDSEQQLAKMALSPSETVKKIHRVIATALVILVLLLVQQHRQRSPLTGINKHLPYLLVALLLVLSVVGPASYLKTLPAIAVVNLVGGILLLGLSWWLWLQLKAPEKIPASSSLQRLARLGLIVVFIQICLGAWVSANFAGLSCQSLTGCGPASEALAGSSGSFWYFRELTLDATGRVAFDQGTLLIQQVHRIGALITASLLLYLSMFARRHGGLVVAALLAAQVCLGMVAVLFQLPLLVVLGHNLLAALLLLSVLKVNYSLSVG